MKKEVYIIIFTYFYAREREKGLTSSTAKQDNEKLKDEL